MNPQVKQKIDYEKNRLYTEIRDLENKDELLVESVSVLSYEKPIADQMNFARERALYLMEQRKKCAQAQLSEAEEDPDR